MQRLLLIPAVLMFTVSLARAQTLTPVATPSPAPAPKDLAKLATDFATSMGLIGPVVCRGSATDGHWTVCQAPVNPGITCGPTSFVCDADGCLIPPGYIPIPPAAPGPSTPIK